MRESSGCLLRIEFALLLAGVVFSMNANAQLGALERVIMPGPVIAAHAEHESECSTCHARFSRQQQRDLCLDCHTEIAEDLASGTGFHSRSTDVAGATCAQCHTEHEGRDADILGLDASAFDHGLTDFPLHDSHVGVACQECHQPDATFHAADSQCISCHRDDDRHLGNLGEVCSDCHEETRWADVTYDHEELTGYPLTGAHTELMCASCHVDEHYVETPNECVDCHREDDTHLGRNGPECQDCHTTTDWAESLFDHFTRTNFALTGGHAGLTCESCHEGNAFEETTTSSECVSCHLDDDAHDGILGPVCADCHSATVWLDVEFDHERDADFALTGAHGDLLCADCHVEPVAASLPGDQCIGCHADDDPHAGQLGETCSSCHGESTWTADLRFDHDLTTFPLLGRHDDVACEDCHATQAFHDVGQLCTDCHVEDDVHAGSLGSDCALCHNPFDWALWRFDHDAQTDFPLDGAHEGLDCAGCHREAARSGVASLPTRCSSCHRADDVHRGEFGDDCDECHTTTSFEGLRALQ